VRLSRLSSRRAGWRHLAVVVAVASVLLAACTGPTAGAPTVEAHATMGAAMPVASGPASATPSGFCADWFKLASASTTFGAAQNASATSEALRASVEATTTYLNALAASAPAEVRSDFGTYARWWADFSVQMARVNYDFTRVASDAELQRAMQATSEPQFTQASANISAWIAQHCNSQR